MMNIYSNYNIFAILHLLLQKQHIPLGLFIYFFGYITFVVFENEA